MGQILSWYTQAPPVEDARALHRRQMQSIMAERFEAYHRAGSPKLEHTWEPSPWFFYGSLAVPHILQHVLTLPEPPTFRPAKLHGHELKMAGPYPAMIWAPDEKFVYGSVYTVQTEEQERILQRYEGKCYEENYCNAKYLDIDNWQDESAEMMKTFLWCGPPSLLRDGEFDPAALPPFEGRPTRRLVE